MILVYSVGNNEKKKRKEKEEFIKWEGNKGM